MKSTRNPLNLLLPSAPILQYGLEETQADGREEHLELGAEEVLGMSSGPNHGRLMACMLRALVEVASFAARCGRPDVSCNCVSLGRTRAIGGTCKIWI